jgi:hypothetical protein
VSVNSVNIVHSVNKVINPHKDNYHYVGGSPPTPSKPEFLLNYVYKSSLYHTENTLRFRYKDQSVKLFRETVAVYYENQTKHSVDRMRSFGMIRQVVHIETTGL